MGIENFIKSTCVQIAVYWGNPVENGFGGKTFDDPIEITCRWENRIDLGEQVANRVGNELNCNAVVFVTQDLDEEGWLYLGVLDDLDSNQVDDPMSVEGAFEIKRFDKIPTLRSTTQFLRKAYLGYKGQNK
jgi:hypothetical protein